MLGVRGLIEAWRRGNVAIANAVGTGVADDKAVYAYMPRIIRYYLSEDPILPNVDTRICAEPDALAYTLDHLAELVVKPVAESGGYGLIIGPHATQRAARRFPRPAERRSVQLYQPADAETLGVADADARRRAAAPYRSAALRGDRQGHLGAARRPHPGRAAGRARWW